MIRSTRGLGAILGLCVLALGIVGASSAQAAVRWQVNGATVTTSEKLVGTLATTGILHTKIGGNEVLFECANGELVEARLEAAGAISTAGTPASVRFTSCITKINGITNPACLPKNNGTEEGVIATNQGTGQLALHSTKEGVTKIKSNVEETVGGLKQPVYARIKMSAECPIGSNIPVIGPSLAVKDVLGNAGLEKEEKAHEIQEFEPLTEIWTLSRTEEHKAKVLGKAKITVVSGNAWSGKPE